MKKLLTIVSLTALLLSGCATADAPATEDAPVADEQVTDTAEVATPEVTVETEVVKGEYYKTGFFGDILSFKSDDGRTFIIRNRDEADPMLNITGRKETCSDFRGNAEIEIKDVKEVEFNYMKTLEATIVSVKSSTAPVCGVVN